jgi:hypothetical protein
VHDIDFYSPLHLSKQSEAEGWSVPPLAMTSRYCHHHLLLIVIRSFSLLPFSLHFNSEFFTARSLPAYLPPERNEVAPASSRARTEKSALHRTHGKHSTGKCLGASFVHCDLWSYRISLITCCCVVIAYIDASEYALNYANQLNLPPQPYVPPPCNRHNDHVNQSINVVLLYQYSAALIQGNRRVRAARTRDVRH